MVISIVIPVYNEERYIYEVLSRVNSVELSDIEKEIVVVNDASLDGTDNEIVRFIASHPNSNINYFKNEKNEGKGYSLKKGFNHASGDFVIVQDADLEYDPNDYNQLLGPLLAGKADVVYGSRFVGDKPHRVLYYWHYRGNRILTSLSNMLTNLNLSDMETCYKVFSKSILDKISLQEKRFGFEPEMTAKISKIPGIRIYEVGISYYGRTYEEGKKINWKDGVRTIYCILKYNLF